MSADNGIYILKTPKNDGFEYRVEHLQSIENLDWDENICGYTREDNIRIINAREMFSDAKVFDNEKDALQFAADLHKELGWTEYGICFLEIDLEF